MSEKSWERLSIHLRTTTTTSSISATDAAVLGQPPAIPAASSTATAPQTTSLLLEDTHLVNISQYSIGKLTLNARKTQKAGQVQGQV